MSWNDYIPRMERNPADGSKIATAVISSLDGVIYAKGSDLQIPDAELSQELQKIGKQFSTMSFQMEGITLGGTKYIFLSEKDGNTVRGKKPQMGIHLIKTNTVIFAAMYKEPVKHEQVAAIVEPLGDYLRQSGS